MTDKQIIIDGVDVSGCVNYRPDVDTTQANYTNACSIGLWQRWYSNLEPNCIMSCSCKDNHNCYYKQKERYKNALNKIKEIAYELTNEEYTDFIESKQKQILQKISECEV